MPRCQSVVWRRCGPWTPLTHLLTEGSLTDHRFDYAQQVRILLSFPFPPQGDPYPTSSSKIFSPTYPTTPPPHPCLVYSLSVSACPSTDLDVSIFDHPVFRTWVDLESVVD